MLKILKIRRCRSRRYVKNKGVQVYFHLSKWELFRKTDFAWCLVELNDKHDTKIVMTHSQCYYVMTKWSNQTESLKGRYLHTRISAKNRLESIFWNLFVSLIMNRSEVVKLLFTLKNEWLKQDRESKYNLDKTIFFCCNVVWSFLGNL